jgi:predicted nucleic acid-binding protein
MKRIESGDERVRTTDTVIFEVVYTLEKFYSASRPEIRDALSDILSLPGILLPRKDSYRRVFELWVSHPRLSFADCYHAALVERLSLPAIISFDRGFDAITSIVRREP